MKTIGLNASLSALALCVAVGGLVQGVAAAGERTAAQLAAAARDDASKASRAIAKRNADDAVRYAELAVGEQPQSAEYRALLGQAYLIAGRFSSASTALTDSLGLAPGDGKVALNLALAQIAEGDWQGARRTLDSNSGSISVSDRGLAMALAGDPGSAVDLMLPMARQPGADSKLRQNLALSLALGGRWQDAKVVAGMDLSPTETDKRIEEWAAFARPTGRADQVASLLGVSPVSDPGQPIALALNAATPVVAVAAVAPTPVTGAPAAAFVAAPAPATVVDPMVAPKPSVSGVVFGARAEVVQPLPIKAVVTAPVKPVVASSPVKSKNFVKPLVATTTPGASKVGVKPVVGKGNFVVQLGAYDSAGVARDGWARASRNFSGYAPQGMPITVAGKTYYRLSVGGFDEAGAKRLCSNYRAKGGKCFVRATAGDTAAAWTKK
ncbi:SPOR domain-containing protein [Sphingomonas panacisoli]|uniref:SPOR domain-containing protein n=1 Tax=Sphingomonas panacisoli TaxID=1813879 RepID=A0A5B8LH31_9SPHN|nr:SPOR domain-containing protein [Sphingomonas panacisoli]QDZ07383.1 SPOR domain-containing protein [Sphingomonas panacisoli]